MPMMTRSANDLEDVLAYALGVEKAGGQMVSVTVEGKEKYPTALEPHNTYRIWAMVFPEDRMDYVDECYAKERYGDDDSK